MMEATAPDIDDLSRRIAARGRVALLERLRTAYQDAAAAHSDIVALEDDQLETLVQNAADHADGLQWRRALAGLVAEELGISVAEALSHPAVARAQSIVGAPSYEQSLAELITRPIPPPLPPRGWDEGNPAYGGGGPPREQEEGAYEEGAFDDAAALLPAPDPSYEVETPTQLYEVPVDEAPDDGAPGGGSPYGEAPYGAVAEAEPDFGPAPSDHEPGFAGEAEFAGGSEPGFGGEPGFAGEPQPEPTADAPVPVAMPPQPMPVPVAMPPQPEPMPVAMPPQPEPMPVAMPPQPEPMPVAMPPQPMPMPMPAEPEAVPAPAPAPTPAPTLPAAQHEDDELRVPAIHLGGVANLPTGIDGLDLRLSRHGLDILRGGDTIIGRLPWPEIEALEVPAARRRRRSNATGAKLVVRTHLGDASFEIPGYSSDELRDRMEMRIDYFRQV